MPTDLENLETRKAAITKALAALDSSEAGGLPNSPTGVDHAGYKRGLYEELRELNQLISQADGPVEIHSQGYPTY